MRRKSRSFYRNGDLSAGGRRESKAISSVLLKCRLLAVMMRDIVVGGCDSCRLPGSPSIHDASFALVVQAMGIVVGEMSGPTFHDSCCGRRL